MLYVEREYICIFFLYKHSYKDIVYTRFGNVSVLSTHHKAFHPVFCPILSCHFYYPPVWELSLFTFSPLSVFKV